MQTAASPASSARFSYRDTPKFLTDWQPWWTSFLQNLIVLFRPEAAAILRCLPGEFWPDVFVKRPLPWINLAESGGLHVLVAALLFGFSSLWISQKPIIADNPFDRTTITYHAVSDYLPEIKSPPAPQKQISKPDPAFAKQTITSVPLHPDNNSQTIDNPPHPEILPHESKLPNLVVNTVIPAPPVAGLDPKLPEIPDLSVKPIAPSPDVRTNARITPAFATTVAQPAPDVRRTSASQLPGMNVTAVAPAPETHAA